MKGEPLSEGQAGAIFRRRFPQYAGYVVSWIVFAVVTFWIFLELRDLAIVLGLRLRFNPWQVRAMDKAVIFLAGMAWLAGVIVSEAYFRGGISNRQVWRRVGRTFLAVLIVGVAIVIAQLAFA